MEKIRSFEELEARQALCTKCMDDKFSGNDGKRHVVLCGGTGCLSSHSDKIREKFAEIIKEKGLDDKVTVNQVGCFGFCSQGPFVKIFPEDTLYRMVKIEDVDEIIEKDICNNEIVERLLYVDPITKQKVTKQDDIEFYKKQLRIALHGCGAIDPENIEEALGAEAFKGLAKALKMDRKAVIQEVLDSGLRGRGGAGFPTGRKWSFVPDVEGPNNRLRLAIKAMEEVGLLGDNILGTDFSFRVHIRLGAGAFVCGEETALLNSIEGKRGMPRPRPPFPAVKGLWGCPTCVNNVETLANVPYILREGAAKYASVGTEKSKGTKVFALGGKINNVGLVEVPMGTTLKELIYDIGGGIPNNKEFKAIQTGGPSGGCLTAKNLDTPIDYDNLIAAGSMMGSGGAIVMDEDNCMVDVAKFYMEFICDESCGKCSPCRIGTKRMLEILTRITEGKGTMEDLDALQELANNVKTNSLCGLGQTAPNPILSTMASFKDEYIAHIVDKKCPAHVCKNLMVYVIDKDKCFGCQMCAKGCPADAIHHITPQYIAPGKKLPAMFIDTNKCVKCGACIATCKFGAISKQ